MKVGDTVVLNDIGLHRIFGRVYVKFLEPMKKVKMKITVIYEDGEVEVDNETINNRMIYNFYLDVVK